VIVTGIHEAAFGEGKEAEISAPRFKLYSLQLILIMELELNQLLLSIHSLYYAPMLVVEHELIVQVHLIK
jgi:hypothetical protein